MSAKIGFHRPVRLIHWTPVRSVTVAAAVAILWVFSPSVARSQSNQSKLDQVIQVLLGEWRAKLSDEESWTLEFRNHDIVWRGGNEVVAEGAAWELEEVPGLNNGFKVILHGESPDEQAMIINFETRDRMMCPLPDGTRAMFDRVGGNAMLNHGFEIPEIGLERFQFVDSVPGWTTTDTEFEVWGTGFLGVKAYEGNQFVELNAHDDGMLSQDQSGIERGATIEFSFAHRGRNGDDTMELTITDLGANNVIGGGDDTNLFTKQYTTGKDAWALYDSANESKIQAVGNTVRFAYTAVFGTGGQGPDKTEGNFLDAANFGVGVVTKRNARRRFPLRPPIMPPFVWEEGSDRGELTPPTTAPPTTPSTNSPVVLGKYQADQPSNDWHYVTIEQGTGGNLLWKNKGGVSWTIEIRKGSEIWFGKDCPYGEMKLEIVPDGAGNFAGLNAGGGIYRLKERTAPTPDAPAPKLPTNFIVETYGVHGRGNADQPKFFIGLVGTELKILQSTLEEALKNENGVQTITREQLDGGLVALKIGDRYLPDFAATVGDANKYEEVAPVFPPDAGEKDFISLRQANAADVYLRHSSYRVFNGGKYDHEKVEGTEGETVFKQDVTWHFHEVPSSSATNRIEIVSGNGQSYGGGGMPEAMVIRIGDGSGKYITDLQAAGLSLHVSSNNPDGKYDLAFSNFNSDDKTQFEGYYYVPSNDGAAYKLQVTVQLKKNGKVVAETTFEQNIKGR